MIASKINSQLSLQLMPTLIHWNMVESNDDLNTIFVLGAGFRYLISKAYQLIQSIFIEHSMMLLIIIIHFLLV